jgi:hydrogenase expression/formation protein HypE
MNAKGLPSCPLPRTDSELIRLGHGSGGTMSAALIGELFLPKLGNETLSLLDDAAIVQIGKGSIAVTTDSYVVSPLVFPGGNIGSLAVHGTINDLAMRGAKPLFIAAGFIIEEGLAIDLLSKLIDAFAAACRDTGVQLIAADTKVVGKGAADKLFITTTGIGLIEHQPAPSAQNATAGDVIIVSGDIGRHGMAIMSTREGLDLETEIVSDSAPLHTVVQAILASGIQVHCLRDITRGGLAGVLNELAAASGVGMEIEEGAIPVHPQVKAVCELLGLDSLYVACEGRFVAIVPESEEERLLSMLNEQSQGGEARTIGRVTCEHPSRVIMQSHVGGKRILDKLSGEQLPRIC